jgi:outer membrane lipoprotein-sorting protein
MVDPNSSRHHHRSTVLRAGHDCPHLHPGHNETNTLKIKTALGLGAAALLTGALSTLCVSHVKGDPTGPPAAASTPAPPASDAVSTNASPPATPPAPASMPGGDALTAATILKTVQATYAALQSYSDTGTAASQMGGFTLTTKFNIRLQRPGLYRIDWQGSSVGVTWSDGTGDFLQYAGMTAQKQQSRQMALAGATGISSGAAANIPGTFFADNWGGTLNGDHQRQKDDLVGSVDCYVLSQDLKRNGMTVSRTLWIGKQDNLIHQIKTVMQGIPQMPQVDDSSLKTILTSQNKPVTPDTIAALRKQLTDSQAKAAEVLKSGNVEFTESHSDIVTNKTFAPTDFKPETP